MSTKIVIAAFLSLAGLAIAVPANAQGMINEKARQKATFYNAPRQIQIIDERPMIHDFREAPQAPGMIQLPPGPGAYPGGAGGGAGGGQMSTGGALPYRTPSNPMGALPKSGFGQFSNIPSRGMAPQSALPRGTSTGVHAAPTAAAVARPAANRPMLGGGGPAPAARRPSGPVAAASYGGSYATPYAGSGRSSSASSNVSGRLMNRLKGN